MQPLEEARAQDTDQYAKAIELVVELCRDLFGSRLANVILYGSTALMDHVPEYSDLDIMLVIEDHLREPHDHELLRAIKTRVKQATGIDVHESWVFGKSLLQSVPIFWEKLGARTIYGEPIIDQAPPPSLSRTASIRMINETRSSWKTRTANMELAEKAKNALSNTLKLAQSALLFYDLDLVITKKTQIVNVFEEKFAGSDISSAPRTAYARILRWKELREDYSVLAQIVSEYEAFSDSLFWYIALRTIFK